MITYLLMIVDQNETKPFDLEVFLSMKITFIGALGEIALGQFCCEIIEKYNLHRKMCREPWTLYVLCDIYPDKSKEDCRPDATSSTNAERDTKPLRYICQSWNFTFGIAVE